MSDNKCRALLHAEGVSREADRAEEVIAKGGGGVAGVMQRELSDGGRSYRVM